jgi:hypothetical protein
MKMRVRAWSVIASSLAALGLMAPGALAATVLHDGLLSTATTGQIVAVGSWDGIPDVTGQSGKARDDNGFQISYLITEDQGLLTYLYVITGVDGLNLSKTLSNIIIEVSPDFSQAQILQGTTPYTELRSDQMSGFPATWEQTGTAGIKWELGDDLLAATIRIITDRQPMQGTFYAKSGDDTFAMPGAGQTFWVPDTLGGGQVFAIPVPSAAWAGAALLAGIGIARLRRLSQAAAV